jgi:hypothetical protein
MHVHDVTAVLPAGELNPDGHVKQEPAFELVQPDRYFP